MQHDIDRDPTPTHRRRLEVSSDPEGTERRRGVFGLLWGAAALVLLIAVLVILML